MKILVNVKKKYLEKLFITLNPGKSLDMVRYQH